MIRARRIAAYAKAADYRIAGVQSQAAPEGDDTTRDLAFALSLREELGIERVGIIEAVE